MYLLGEDPFPLVCWECGAGNTDGTVAAEWQVHKKDLVQSKTVPTQWYWSRHLECTECPVENDWDVALVFSQDDEKHPDLFYLKEIRARNVWKEETHGGA